MGFLTGLFGGSAYAQYGGHTVNNGEYVWPARGIRKPIGGATATYESGANVGGRTTLTRVGVGAIVAGPVGAIVGGMFKKDRNRCYVTLEFPDREVVVVDGPAKDERLLREFAAKFNTLSRDYS